VGSLTEGQRIVGSAEGSEPIGDLERVFCHGSTVSDSIGPPSSAGLVPSPLCTWGRDFVCNVANRSLLLFLGLFLALGRGGAFLEHLGIERLELEFFLLDDGDVLAARLAISLVLGAGDVQRHGDDHLRM
jgi:hypothetical protein